ncbi:PAS domain-containing protein [Methylobacterium soli]|uniref:PAS domain-containing protein n=2 Tax=Methylobacterium soli TaxID=553447 RepID=UPI00177BB392|nr:PAS domain-containing protein [Methylobacterium soli]
MIAFPNTALPAFSSQEFLRLIENYGLSGTWGWTFATNAQVWSPGLYRLLGLQPDSVRPSYALLLSLVHPDDRASLDTPDQVRQDGTLRSHVFRVIRPDGTMRILSSRGEVYVTPEGQPRNAAGMIMDVSERETLSRISMIEKQREHALAQQARIFTCSNRVVPFVEYPADLVSLAGLTRQDLLDNWLAHVVPEEWSRWLEETPRLLGTGKPFITRPTLKLVDGERARFRYTVVPVYESDGSLSSWTAAITPMETHMAASGGELQQGLEQNLDGGHLRAARALLGWSMMELAQASGLSFSTVRRLEDNGEATASRSRHAAAAALRAAGIRFSLLDGNTIAVAKL